GALPLGDGASVTDFSATRQASRAERLLWMFSHEALGPGWRPERRPGDRWPEPPLARNSPQHQSKSIAKNQRLENWVARRALCRPTFLRSTARASRVMNPARRSDAFRVSSYSTSARAMPRRIAPACPVMPPPATLTLMSNLSAIWVSSSGWRTIMRDV